MDGQNVILLSFNLYNKSILFINWFSFKLFAELCQIINQSAPIMMRKYNQTWLELVFSYLWCLSLDQCKYYEYNTSRDRKGLKEADLKMSIFFVFVSIRNFQNNNLVCCARKRLNSISQIDIQSFLWCLIRQKLIIVSNSHIYCTWLTSFLLFWNIQFLWKSTQVWLTVFFQPCL